MVYKTLPPLMSLALLYFSTTHITLYLQYISPDILQAFVNFISIYLPTLDSLISPLRGI